LIEARSKHVQRLIAVLLVACADPVIVAPVDCDSPCYTGPTWTRHVGTCRDGWPRCVDRLVITCEGEVLPREEVCVATEDLNCDGRIGVDLTPPVYREVCGSNVGACRLGAITCVEGVVVCAGEVAETLETCNGVDDDCDGVIDNLTPKICYDGNPLELTRPLSECRAGVIACDRGATVCAGQVLPRDEACGSGLDLNCNGRVDDDDTTPGEITLAFVLDRSCSMADIDNAIRGVMIDLAGIRVAPRYRYSLIDVPGNQDSLPAWQLLSVSSAVFVEFVRGHDTLAGSNEYQLDALNEIARMGLAPGYAIVFTDEPAQALREDTLPADVDANLRTARIEPLIFARDDDRASFVPMLVRSIYSDVTVISNALDSATNTCR